ncbi:MAG: phosphomannomutase, partial [Thermodesulfobacteriota bacterium]|nr:phosphomannomutase [Thermodesulfobacteriota bacterium]
AHHYFRDFAYCDSGMIPWLFTGLMSQKKQLLSAMLDERIALYPASGEINRRLDDPSTAIARAQKVYGPQVHGIDETDGISMELDGWRFNLRCSNTEPVLRLNVESRADIDLMQEKTAELLALIETSG